MKARELVVNAALLASTTAYELREDPLQFILQASRRLPRALPACIGKAVSIGCPGPVRAAYGAWIADRPQWARDALAATPIEARGRAFAELASALDAPDLIPAAQLRGALATRVARRRGDIVDPSPEFTSRCRPLPRAGRATGEPLSVFHLLTNSVPHTGSGYAYRSHAVLKAQRDAGLRVAAATRLGYPVIVGKAGAAHHDVVDGIDYYRLITAKPGGSLHKRTQQSADLLEPLVRSFGADVLSTTTDYTNALVAQEVASRLGIAWTYEVRGLPEDTWAANQPTPERRSKVARSTRYLALQQRELTAASSADHVFTLGSALRDDFVARGVPRANITVVRNAAEAVPERDLLTSREARSALRLPLEGFWVGSVGSLVPYEGLDVLLSAVALARAQGVDLRAMLVGDGIARPSLEAHAQFLGLRPGVDVVFPGRVAPADTPTYYQALDLFAVPRRDERVCRLVPPLKPLGAMAVGRPVAASDVPAIRALFAEAHCGPLIPAGDPAAWVDTLIDLTPDLYAQDLYGQQGRSYIANASWPTEGATYLAALNCALDLGLSNV